MTATNRTEPRMVYNKVRTPACHPTWDNILNHIGRQILGLQNVDRRPELNLWVHGLVLQPEKKQPALLLIGPECSGKTVFHEAMGLLLPPRAVLHFPDEARQFNWPALDDRKAAWEERLRQTWLVVVQDTPTGYVNQFRRPKRRDERYLKWCLTHTHDVEPLPNVQRFDVGLLGTTVPRTDLLRRLEDECEAFQRTLAKYRAVA